jgi:hypothetical protein
MRPLRRLVLWLLCTVLPIPAGAVGVDMPASCPMAHSTPACHADGMHQDSACGAHDRAGHDTPSACVATADCHCGAPALLQAIAVGVPATPPDTPPLRAGRAQAASSPPGAIWRPPTFV